MIASHTYALKLQARTICPHCWHAFSPEEVLWVSRHPDLLGDLRLGAEQQQRFLPTRFSIEGDALDSEGFTCNAIACPRCHLNLPRAMMEMTPLFSSILGAPGSGKSYFLAAMTWALRQQLPKLFKVSLTDVEPTAHINLNAYEETLFLNGKPNDLVALPKTDLQGDHLYDTVQFGEQHMMFPRPFVFGLRPLTGHPKEKQADTVSRALCLYDNAGEHFLPGSDKVGTPVTQHLAISRFLFFLFDPTQDPRFREEMDGRSPDPQIGKAAKTYRQETILLEAADRVRRYAGVAQTGKHQKPLIVVVTKFDAWCSILGQETGRPVLPQAYVSTPQGTALDPTKVEEMSRAVRLVLNEFAREFVAAAESFAEHVIYVPVSALGSAPELDPATNALCIRPRNIRSLWVEMPMIYALARWGNGLVPLAGSRTQAPASLAVKASGKTKANAVASATASDVAS
ncbi:MAG: hypothetical protein JNM18_08895 [Planctomycetaceae bacterium]|nr:hypothetical protein [Planctomycetaceae bacterium]